MIGGITATEFAPNAEITREQMAVLLVRAYEYISGQSINAYAKICAYSDEAAISGWAKAGVNKAITAGFIQGSTDQVFAPKSSTTYLEVKQALYNVLLN